MMKRVLSLIISFVPVLAEAQTIQADTGIILLDEEFKVISGQVKVTPQGVVLEDATIFIRSGVVVSEAWNLEDAGHAGLGQVSEEPWDSEVFLKEVRKCWNTGALSTEALRTTVVVTVQMNQDGTPETGTIRMVDSQGGSTGSANQAFQAARRAIIRCGARGFDLPPEKYEQWREIEMTFNPEKMRIK